MPDAQDAPTKIANPYEELVSSFLMGQALDVWRSLPETVDQAEQDESLNSEGLNLYDRMMRMSIVQGAVNQWRAAVLSAPITIGLPSEFDNIEPDDMDPAMRSRYDQAVEIQAFVQRSIDNLKWYRSPSISEVAWDLLGSIIQGHSLAEIVLAKEVDGVDAGKETLRRVKHKPRKNYRMVVDPYNNLVGILAIKPGKNLALWSGTLGEIFKHAGFVPVEKLAIMTLGGQGDPRGTSMLRGAYDPWKRTQIMRPVQVKTGVQFGGGMITATLGPNAQGGRQTGEDGVQKELSAPDFARANLKNMQSGSVGVFAEGTVITVHRPGDGGGFFEGYFAEAKRDIAVAILTTARSIMEAERSSKADAGAAENVLDTVTFWMRGRLCECLGNSIVRLLVERNYGAAIARTLMPTVLIGGTRWEDLLKNGSNLASLGYQFAPEHMANLDRRFGLPPRAEVEDVEGADGAVQGNDSDEGAD